MIFFPSQRILVNSRQFCPHRVELVGLHCIDFAEFRRTAGEVFAREGSGAVETAETAVPRV
jgi:hypothetical protein